MKIIIVGGTAAGTSAAAKAKRVKTDVEIIIYELTSLVSFGACGLPYFIGGFFDDPKYMIARTPEEFEKQGIKVKTNHEVIKLDIKLKKVIIKNLITGEEFKDNYDKLMIATGSNTIIPSIDNINLENSHTLKSMEDGKILKKLLNNKNIKNIVIIGAGYIGIEVIEAAKHKGKNVRVIELKDRILSDYFDKEITDIMESELIKEDVNLNLNETAIKIKGQKQVESILTNKGEYKADLIILTTGVAPNTRFLEKQLKTLKNGAIIINKYGETSVKDIYSAGDCATVYNLVTQQQEYIPLATTANKIGRIVGENLVGKKNPFIGTLSSASIKVINFEVGKTGITEEKAKLLGIEYNTIFIKDKNHSNYYPDQEDILAKIIYRKDTKELLGGQMISKHGAVLRVDVLATAIHAKMKIHELGMLDFCYSPPYSKAWDILNIIGNAAK